MLGLNSTLRYAVQMLQPATIVSKVNNNYQVTIKDVEEAAELFIDAKSSSKILMSQSKSFLVWIQFMNEKFLS